MRILSHLFKKTDPPVPPPAEGRAARNRALDTMSSVDHRWSEVLSISKELSKIRRENHFADTISKIFKDEL